MSVVWMVASILPSSNQRSLLGVRTPRAASTLQQFIARHAIFATHVRQRRRTHRALQFVLFMQPATRGIGSSTTLLPLGLLRRMGLMSGRL